MGKLNTPEAQQLRGIRKEKAKRVGRVVKGALLGGVAGALVGKAVGEAGAGAFKGTAQSKQQGKAIATASGAGLGAQLVGGLTSYKNPVRTQAQKRSERAQVKTLRPIVRAQRKSK